MASRSKSPTWMFCWPVCRRAGTHRLAGFRLCRDTGDVQMAGRGQGAAPCGSLLNVADPDFRGLRLLRDRLGADFLGGVLLNLGQRSYTYDDRLHVMPLDRLWA